MVLVAGERRRIVWARCNGLAPPFFFHPEADAEFIDAASYYGERSLTVGLEFLQVIDAAIAAAAMLGNQVRRQ